MNDHSSGPELPTSPATASRRRFLTGLGGGVAALAIPATIATSSADAATRGAVPSAAPAAPPLPLGDIQGNVLGGFNKDHQALIAIVFPNAGAGRAWVDSVRSHVASAAEVLAFNNAYRSVASRAGARTALLTSSWMNVAFTHAGLAALGLRRNELDQFPPEFRAGMAARADHLGDTGRNAPSNWPAPFRQRAHAVLVLAADVDSDLDSLIAAQSDLAGQSGVNILWTQRGAARSDEPGHEHFGFKDGISQPGVRGVTVPSDPSNPDRGIPGQDLLWPGEFVLGQPTQAGVGQPITKSGPPSIGGPGWTVNGSYLVFRRLSQDVAGFRSFVAQAAAQQGISTDLMGAKLMGRYKSGAALESTGAVSVDPGRSDASLLSDAKVNDFEYGNDADGRVVPLGAHIRKAYPRDEATKDGGESDTQTHRLIRRGIPFGVSLPADAGSADPAASAAYPNDRGLLFLCYQSSIHRQFEFVQNHWVNNPDFPRRDSGHDPVVAQTATPGSFTLPGGRPDHVALMQRFVTTTGGDYFFSPSLSALQRLAQVVPPPAPLPPPRPRHPRPRPR